jgi:hypothetical protein
VVVGAAQVAAWWSARRGCGAQQRGEGRRGGLGGFYRQLKAVRGEDFLCSLALRADSTGEIRGQIGGGTVGRDSSGRGETAVAATSGDAVRTVELRWCCWRRRVVQVH